MLQFRLLGNWKSADKFLENLPYTIRQASQDSQRDIAIILKKKVINHIKDNDIDLEPLAISTIKHKHGETRPLLDSGDYMRAITIWTQNKVFYVGVKKSARNHEGKSIYMIANILEYGAETHTGTIPERPLWKISIEELGGRKGIRNYTEKKIKARLRITNSRYANTFKIN